MSALPGWESAVQDVSSVINKPGWKGAQLEMISIHSILIGLRKCIRARSKGSKNNDYKCYTLTIASLLSNLKWMNYRLDLFNQPKILWFKKEWIRCKSFSFFYAYEGIIWSIHRIIQKKFVSCLFLIKIGLNDCLMVDWFYCWF